MEKTYKFVDHLHPEPLPMCEIERLYTGWWVFLTNATYSNSEPRQLLSARPAVIGIRQYDGAFDNIYDRFNTPEYGAKADRSLLVNKLIASLQASGVSNA